MKTTTVLKVHTDQPVHAILEGVLNILSGKPLCIQLFTPQRNDRVVQKRVGEIALILDSFQSNMI